MVPTCHYPWSSFGARHWPVIGPLHHDAELVGFPYLHFHIDGRFLDRRTWRRLDFWHDHHDAAMECIAKPLSFRWLGELLEHPPVAFHRRLCQRNYQWPERIHGSFPKLHQHFAGTVCKRARGAIVCPHQGVRLTIPTQSDGFVRCPLHGLVIDAASGVVQ